MTQYVSEYNAGYHGEPLRDLSRFTRKERAEMERAHKEGQRAAKRT